MSKPIAIKVDPDEFLGTFIHRDDSWQSDDLHAMFKLCLEGKQDAAVKYLTDIWWQHFDDGFLMVTGSDPVSVEWSSEFLEDDAGLKRNPLSVLTLPEIMEKVLETAEETWHSDDRPEGHAMWTDEQLEAMASGWEDAAAKLRAAKRG